MHEQEISRRGFLGAGAGLPLALLGAGAALQATGLHSKAAAQSAPARPSVCVFSKHLQFLDYDELGATCAALGLDSVDLTVRPGGHVLPANLDRDLPRAVEAVQNAGLSVSMLTTALTQANAQAEEILAACAALGIGFVRIGGHRYSDDAPVHQQLAQVTEELEGLTHLAAEHDIRLGYHNHSGYGYFGGPVWDLLHAYQTIDQPHIGSNLDLGHVTVEGAYGAGMVIVRLLAELQRVHMVALKDFVWENGQPRWLPLGEGLTPTQDYLRVLRQQGFSGPVSLHFEYDTGSNEGMVEEIGAAVPVINRWLDEAGYPEQA